MACVLAAWQLLRDTGTSRSEVLRSASKSADEEPLRLGGRLEPLVEAQE
jgi:hypothetical protein